MPQYNLTGPEREIAVSWLFEQVGYLDVAVNDAGVLARQALALSPTLDVTVWIRANTKAPVVEDRFWLDCGLFWWVWKRAGVNITPGSRPPETAAWLARLKALTAKLDEKLLAVPEDMRNCTALSGVAMRYVPDGKGGQYIEPGDGPLRRYELSPGHYAVCDPRPIPLVAEDGSVIGTMLPGSHLVTQRSMFEKVIPVLGG